MSATDAELSDVFVGEACFDRLVQVECRESVMLEKPREKSTLEAVRSRYAKPCRLCPYLPLGVIGAKGAAQTDVGHEVVK